MPPKVYFWKKLVFCTNRVDPPSPLVGTPKNVMSILHFRLFWAFYFFHEKVHFFGFMRLVLGYPPLPGSWYTKIKKKLMFILHFRLLQKVGIHSTPTPLIWKLSQVYTKFCRFFLTNSWRGFNNIMNWWDITPPFMYCVFHHISISNENIFFGKFYKKLVKGRTPSPGWYKLPSFFRR